MTDILLRCRALLNTPTPLRSDCGALCGARCCSSLAEDEETGMLLFPGEEAFYENLPGFTIRETDHGRLLICGGTCDRSQRPLSCRMFPLLPIVREGEIRVVMDARAKAVCPLYASGKRGLDADFADQVKAAGELLLTHPETKAMLEQLTSIHDEIKALQKQFEGSR